MLAGYVFGGITMTPFKREVLMDSENYRNLLREKQWLHIYFKSKTKNTERLMSKKNHDIPEIRF